LGAVGKGEAVQVRPVPAGERVVDCVGERGEGVAAGGGEDSPGAGPDAGMPTALNQLDPDR
jgi:hypothetical protein